MKAVIQKDLAGTHRIFAQRAKFKHWFELGRHTETSNAFYKAYSEGTIQWVKKIFVKDSLFQH